MEFIPVQRLRKEDKEELVKSWTEDYGAKEIRFQRSPLTGQLGIQIVKEDEEGNYTLEFGLYRCSDCRYVVVDSALDNEVCSNCCATPSE